MGNALIKYKIRKVTPNNKYMNIIKLRNVLHVLLIVAMLVDVGLGRLTDGQFLIMSVLLVIMVDLFDIRVMKK